MLQVLLNLITSTWFVSWRNTVIEISAAFNPSSALAAFSISGAGASVKIPPLTNPLLRDNGVYFKGDAIVSVKPVTKTMQQLYR
jgi:hypothetical protein